MRLALLFSLLLVVLTIPGIAQDFPRHMTPEERRQLLENGGLDKSRFLRGIETPPPFDNLRTMAEWEEIEALTISWTSYPGILKQIVRAAKEECVVVILTENPGSTESYLMGNQSGGPLNNMENVVLLDAEINSVWMRDYAGNTVYGNEVDNRIMVDWIYNRPSRPDDDASPQYIADYYNLDLYTTTSAPSDLVNTGGNFMSDGFGTAFASKLILEENEPGNDYGVSAKDANEINLIKQDWMGIDRYIKMEMLPFDIIHHIDMHMKLLDEETLLVGEYPEGIADGPQINANIEYVLSNFNSAFGTPYNVLRIPMPPSTGNLWPDSEPAAYYRTYTNSVFVNKTIIYPSYREEYDTIAERIYGELMPGYTLVPIDCDNNAEPIIAASGAIHCITHSVGVEEPLLISHQPLNDTYDTENDYDVAAYLNHRSGIASATLWYKTELAASYNAVPMVPVEGNNWAASIPAQAAGSTVYYYIEGQSQSGKLQVRPIVAPDGYWKFRVLGDAVGIEEMSKGLFGKVFPNPASAITCIPLSTKKSINQARIVLRDINGREILEVFQGNIPAGESKYFLDASALPAAAYVLVLEAEEVRDVWRLMVN